MARLIEVPGSDGPLNEGERRVVQTLLSQLPDGYWVAAGVELAEQNGQSFDYDAIVIAPHAVYAIEIKDWHGHILGDHREWLVNNDVRRAPILSAQRKARVLKSRLAARAPALGRVWVEAAVVLATPPAQLDLTEEARYRTFLVSDLIEFIMDPSGVRKAPNAIQDLVSPILRFFGSHVMRRSGPLVFGNYEVIETLEQSQDEGWYRAKHRLLAGAPAVRLHVVSLSPFTLDAKQREEQRGVLVRETEALLRMGSHPNVVAARESFEDDSGRIIVVLDDTQGRTLRQRLQEGTPMTVQERIDVLEDVAQALAHAHAHGVVHRQVEPQSILLLDDGTARLARFGLAKIMAQGVATVWHDDTVDQMDRRYLAPELLNPSLGEVGPRTDLYELATVAYELFAGQPPFADPMRAFGAMPALPDGTPAPLREALPALLNGQPDLRPTSAQHLLSALSHSRKERSRRVTGPKLLYDAGDLIDNDFEVRSRLGGGGFSNVYRVYRALDDREFAVKVFNANVDFDKVQREVTTLRQISHPRIVHMVWASRTREGQWYLVTDLVQGETLTAYTDGRKLMAPGEAVSLICDVLSALEAIHPNIARIAALRDLLDAGNGGEEEFQEWQRLSQSGIIHRDIKPENLMLTADGVVLIDFNIASPVGQPVYTTSGTLNYMAPDITAGIDTWETSPDLFAVGIVLYELLCRDHPYLGATPRIDYLPRDPRELQPDLSPALAEFLLKACAPFRGDRFASAHEMRAALQAIDPLVLPANGHAVHKLSAQLQALIDAALPNTNPFVTAFLALSSQARRTNRRTRGLDDLAVITYVETRLDSDLAQSVLAGTHHLVIVTGNAGDGKTAFIQQVERAAKRAGAVTVSHNSNGSILRYAGQEVHTLYDGSQDESDRTSDAVLCEFLAPFRDGADEAAGIRLAAINEGRLRDFLLTHRVEFRDLAYSLLSGLDDPNHHQWNKDVVLVNLNLRSVTAGKDQSIFSRQLRQIVDGQFWEFCEVCVHKARCPIKHNVDTFRDPSCGPEITERLRTLVDLISLRRRRHLTIRDIRSLISYVLFRDRTCEEIGAALTSDDAGSLVDLAYFQALGGLGTPPGSITERGASLLSEVDVALVSNPIEDRALARGQGPRLMQFTLRSGDYPSQLIDTLREQAGAGYEGDPGQARRAHRAARRHLFFERADDGWWSMLPYNRLSVFHEALAKTDQDHGLLLRLREESIEAISRYEGIVSTASATQALWIAAGAATTTGLRSFRRFPSADFTLRAVSVGAQFIEAEPDRLQFVHAPSNTILELTLDMVEVLERLREGYMPTAEEGRGFLINLELFKQRLLALESSELVIVGEDRQMRIAVGTAAGSVELREDGHEPS
jgi:serine/threonine protein kinase